MKKIKKGDIVVRKSYGKDIIFYVKRIVKTSKEDIAIICGLFERIEADSLLTDLELLDSKTIKNIFKDEENRLNFRMNKRYSNYESSFIENERTLLRRKIITGKILHLDGDKRYSQKSYNYYQKMGLNAIVKNIPEYKQPKVVYKLLKLYRPDILIITGHDGMIKNGARYRDIYNYRNSRHFIQTVKEARRYDEKHGKKLVIFAGACQSYFEALMDAGANFASSPARILIDFLDPLVVAKSIALTDKNKYIIIDDFVDELRDGKKGIDGIGARGKKNVIFL